MLKKLAAGEYSLKIIFWLFGLLGFLIFFLLASATHNGAVRAICPYGQLCPVNILWFTASHFLMVFVGRLSSNIVTYLIIHLFVSTLFVIYMYITVRGLWKCCESYKGAKFWAYGAKIILVGLMLFCFKSII